MDLYGNMNCLKAQLQDLPSTPAFPSKVALVQVLITVIQLLRGDLVVASLTLRSRCGLLLHDMDYLPPVYPMKVIPKYASSVRQHGAPWKGALIFSNVSREYGLIYLGYLFLLSYQYPVIVNRRICTM